MNKNDDKKKVYNQIAWILNYQPTIKEQHIHMGRQKTEDEPTGEEAEYEEVDHEHTERDAEKVVARETAQETFADRVKAIMRKAATKNGQHIKTTAKGHSGDYVYHVDAEAFCKAMDEMVKTYDGKLKELLGGSLNCLQVTKVCSFIGHVVRMHVVNDANLQTVDMLFAFEGYYENLQTVKSKLGNKKITSEEKVILGCFEGLLKKYTAK